MLPKDLLKYANKISKKDSEAQILNTIRNNERYITMGGDRLPVFNIPSNAVVTSWERRQTRDGFPELTVNYLIYE